MKNNIGPVLALKLALALSLLLPSVAGAVNCNTDGAGALQAAIDAAVAGATINVTGTCNENVEIDEAHADLLTLDGGGGAVIDGPDAAEDTITVRGRGIRIRNFLQITGGRDGIGVSRGGTVIIENNTIENTGSRGIQVNQQSFVTIVDNTIQNNPSDGILVNENSMARIGIRSGQDTVTSPNSIGNNGGRGIFISRSSTARIVGNTISNNGSGGILVNRVSRADVAGNLVNGNGGDGIFVTQNSGVNLGSTGGAIFDLPNETTVNNSGVGIRAAVNAYADGVFGSLSGSAGAKSFDSSSIDNLTVSSMLKFSAATYSVSETGPQATITVTRTGGTASAVTVDYATSNGSADSPGDYAATAGTLNFAAGQTSRTFTIPIVNDTIGEANETVNLTLSNPTGGASLGMPSTAVLTITDNDVAVRTRFSAATYSVSETGPQATITVTRTGGTASAVTVDYATSNGSAESPEDYAATAGTLNFAAGQTSRTFTIPIVNDTIDEANETVNLTLSDPTSGAILGTPSTAVLTIADNDVAGKVRFTAATYSVNELGSPVATITVLRSGGTASGITVNYATSDGSATTPADYTVASGTLNFGVGETSKTFTVQINDDALPEGNHTVNLALSTLTGGAVLGTPNAAVLTIVDDELSVHFKQASYHVNEGGRATITVVRSGPTTSAFTVDYSTSNGSAVGADYTTTTGTLAFAAGHVSKNFTVSTTNDTIDENTETVNLMLSNPTGGVQLGTQSTANLNIVDNDSGGEFRFNSVSYSVSEASAQATITVTRTGGTASAVTVEYATEDGTAESPGDYAETTGTLSFSAGQTSKTFTIPIVNDTIDEANETVNLALSNPTGGASLGVPSTAVLTILSNDVTDIRGNYTIPGSSLTQSECTGVLLDDTFDVIGTLIISSQSGRSFSGTATLDHDDGLRTTVRLSGTVAPGGEQLSGSFSFSTTEPGFGTVASGSGKFTGTLIGNEITLDVAGVLRSGGATCQLNGELIGEK